MNREKIIARFDPNDEALIARAAKTRHPAHVAEVLAFAAVGFMRRIEEQGALTECSGGHLHIKLAKPATAFDRIVIRMVLQMYCDGTGKEIFASYFANPTGAGSPDVTFIP